MEARVIKIVAIVAVTASIGVIAQQESSTPASQPETVMRSAIISKLEEIVNIRERILRAVEQERRSGHASNDGAAEVALEEARIELAGVRGQPEAVLQALTNLVSVQRQRVDDAELMRKARIATGLEVENARVDLLTAEVRLLRAREKR